MLESLLTPKSVAVIGASKTPGKVGYAIAEGLLNGGFKGTLTFVNPTTKVLLGQPCYPDLKHLKDPVDLGIVVVPTSSVMGAVDTLLDAGAKALVVITAGFKEVGPEGAKLEKEVADRVRSRGARMLGPNCLGFINAHFNLNASFAKQIPKRGNISLISQSGALMCAILDWAAERKLGMSKLFSIGNKADLSENDFFEVLADDPETKVVMTYLESIASGELFIQAAEKAASVKPVVVLKAGVTSAGQKATSSHTGSLAGADIAYGAAFSRAGVIRAQTFEELSDYCTAFAMQPLPKGNRVAIVTNAGGPGAMAADALEQSGLVVANLNRENAAALKSKLPAAASVGNPIDVLGDADPERYALAVQAAQDDPSVDAVIVILTPQAMTQPAETAMTVAKNVKGVKPVLAVFMGGTDVLPGREKLVENGLPDYPSPDRAVGALKAMVDYAAWRNRPVRVVTRFPVNRTRVERVLQRNLKEGRRQIGEVDAKEILRAYEFNVPEGQLCATSQEAVEAAERIGYPVVMKISSPDIIHKSDVGGVKLNLSNKDAVLDAYDLMMLRTSQRAAGAKLDGVYLERMGNRGLEVILGMTRDPQFGPMLMFGLGGIFVEVMKDVTFHLAPITADEAMQMLTRTRSYALLKGARGQAGVNIPAIAQALQRISQLVTDFPQIVELDINPLIVGGVETQPVVADGRMTLSAGA